MDHLANSMHIFPNLSFQGLILTLYSHPVRTWPVITDLPSPGTISVGVKLLAVLFLDCSDSTFGTEGFLPLVAASSDKEAFFGEILSWSDPLDSSTKGMFGGVSRGGRVGILGRGLRGPSLMGEVKGSSP